MPALHLKRGERGSVPASRSSRAIVRKITKQSQLIGRCTLPATAATTAAARDIAITFGAKHPEAGMFKAIQAVLDQLENLLSFTNQAAWEKHSVGRTAFKGWKKPQ